MKWLPVPSVPRWISLFDFAIARCFAQMASKRSASPAHACSTGFGAVPHAPRSRPRRPPVLPCGTAFSIAVRIGRSESGRSLAVSEVCTAIMPQPMSTPTAAGTTAPRVGTTLPIVAPMPQWTSGITATWRCTKGSEATLRSCARASSSNATPRVHDFTGTPPGMFMTSKFASLCSAIGLLSFGRSGRTGEAGSRGVRPRLRLPGSCRPLFRPGHRAKIVPAGHEAMRRGVECRESDLVSRA